MSEAGKSIQYPISKNRESEEREMKPYSDTVQRTARKGVGSAKKKKAAVQKGIAKVSTMVVVVC